MFLTSNMLIYLIYINKIKLFKDVLMKIFFLLFIVFFSSTYASVIKLIAVNNCPYSCSEDEKDQGFAVDLIREVFKRNGYEISYQSFESHELALENIKEGSSDIMIDVDPVKNRDLIFMKTPLGYQHNVIVTPTYSKWKYTSPESLASLKLAAIEEETYTNEIAKYIEKNRADDSKLIITSGHLARKHNLKSLRFEKITALIDDRIALRYFYFKKHKPFAFKVAYTAPSKAIYIAFSAKSYRSNKYTEILHRGLKRLENSKRAKEIFKKYGLSEAYIRPLVKAH